MRVQTEEWRRFIPGVRMYKGKLTYFYNGEKLWDEENLKYLVYTKEERQKWEVIMVLPGVDVILFGTFKECVKVETVIMNDTVRLIEQYAFFACIRLVYVKLSKTLRKIGKWAFIHCLSMATIFIPTSCGEIDEYAFQFCKNLKIIVVPANTQCFKGAFRLFEDIPENREFTHVNRREEYALHRVCSSMDPSLDDIYRIVREQGIIGLRRPNALNITPLQYLKANPYANVSENEIITRYISEMMGEIF
ncbi:hypothetical protein CTEN210_13971 [Chaetoceros tenuissimus]|uniref:Leucine-rich repeat domain-containing protein n=1 Tax=Chaetoceros tenuissimus TaxID=426638 RepID=A0AAD3D663_9STRA|nr:hypothetical protein CTEN210_13971 [Chaetoceros tenuissimus]